MSTQFRSLPAVVAVLMLAAFAGSNADATDLAAADDKWRLDMLGQLNAIRAQHGLGTLQIDERLNRAAQLHSNDMAARDFFDHEAPDGARMTDRASAFGYRWRLLRENIAAGQRSVGEAVTGWMNSRDHRAAILDPKIRDAGMGYTYQPRDAGRITRYHYWTLLVGLE